MPGNQVSSESVSTAWVLGQGGAQRAKGSLIGKEEMEGKEIKYGAGSGAVKWEEEPYRCGQGGLPGGGASPQATPMSLDFGQ